MNDLMRIATIVKAYEGAVSENEARQVYQQWIELRRKEMGSLNVDLVEAALNSLTKTQIDLIHRTPASNRGKLLTANLISTELGLIDQRVRRCAEQVGKGKTLGDRQRIQASEDQQSLRAILKKIDNLPNEFGDQLRPLYSEMILDSRYAIADGRGPMSLRLGKMHNPRLQMR